MAPHERAQGARRPRSPDRPLNVMDALRYIDAVRMQYQDTPGVYDAFMDIMRGFKDKVIDTPGVMHRVSALFQGNPGLIRDFTVFLPSGFSIEVSEDPRDAGTVTITTPQGTAAAPHEHRLAPPTTRGAQNAAASLGGMRTPLEESASDREFRRAIEFVDKVKLRYADDAGTYTQFLALLKAHREQGPLQSQVYVRVERLFKDAPDLVSEFKDFLSVMD